MVAAEAEIHALLKTGALTLAHLDVGNDVVAHGAFLDAELELDRSHRNWARRLTQCFNEVCHSALASRLRLGEPKNSRMVAAIG